VTERDDAAALIPDDPSTRPYWEAALEGRLALQRCNTCAAHQLYPRPFCLACESNDLDWVDAAGFGAVYSVTVNRLHVLPDLEPPYAIALVELDEGPRVMTHVDGDVQIGDRVAVAWRQHTDALPTLIASPE